MRIAVLQGKIAPDHHRTASDQAEQALAAAGQMGASVLVLPELWLSGYNRPDLHRHALAHDAPVFGRLAVQARLAGCGLVLGYAEIAGQVLHNSAMYLDPDGKTRVNYRKLQLYGPRERALFRPGLSYVTFALGGRKAAMLICYDVEFAPHVAALARQGVELLLVPTANMLPFVHVVRHGVPAMAASYGLAIAYSNYCGSEGGLDYVGGSLIAGPHGEVLAQAGEHPALMVVDLPPVDPARLSTQATDFRPL